MPLAVQFFLFFRFGFWDRLQIKTKFLELIRLVGLWF